MLDRGWLLAELPGDMADQNTTTAEWEHPCLRCGACCAHFRVSMHWREAADAGGTVPTELTEDWNSTLRIMKGTVRSPCRCVALEGTVGQSVACSIYEQRSAACRDLVASWEHGEVSDQCDRARAAHGMRPLTPDDFIGQPKKSD